MVKNTTCKICRFYGKISTHVKPKHGLTILQYYDQYIALENETIGFIYVNKGYSANQIKSFVQYKTDCSISPSKKNIYEHLRENSIFIRPTSEAIEKWSCNRGGPWNKDIEKLLSLNNKGYSVIILWENTYKSLLTEDIKSWLKYEINKHKTNKKI